MSTVDPAEYLEGPEKPIHIPDPIEDKTEALLLDGEEDEDEMLRQAILASLQTAAEE